MTENPTQTQEQGPRSPLTEAQALKREKLAYAKGQLDISWKAITTGTLVILIIAGVLILEPVTGTVLSVKTLAAMGFGTGIATGFSLAGTFGAVRGWFARHQAKKLPE